MPDTIDRRLLQIIVPDGQHTADTYVSSMGDGADGVDQASFDSPLWMITQEPLLNEFVLDLRRLHDALMRQPDARCELQFSKGCLNEVRKEFAHMIRRGEERLHQLSNLISDSLLSSFQIQSVVIGEVDSTKERFTLSQSISTSELYTTTDIDLGNRQLSKLQFFDGNSWSRASLVANVVEYQPTEPNPYAVHRIITRIKAEEEIWNKVVDEIFELDRIVRRDKKLRHLSRYVKDIFGIKIVVGGLADVYGVYKALVEQTWTPAQLESLGVEPCNTTNRLEIVEVKDYLPQEERKKSGWAAVKLVVRWGDKTFEIQIQPLRNFLREREVLTKESHTSFKKRRERIRNQIAEHIPLFRFYQDLLLWLFLHPDLPPPAYNRAHVRLLM